MNYGGFSITSAFHDLLQNSQYRSEVIELLELSAMNYSLRFAEKREEYDFVRYEKYDRKEVSRLLGWERDEYNTIFGYKVDYVKKTCPIIVTYHKHESIDSSIAYDDQFIDAEHFAWQSRTNVRIDSKEMIGIRNPAMKKLLFIKKSDDEGSAHYYLGHMEYIKNEQSTRKNDKGAVLPVVNVQFRLHDSVPENLYAYITEQIEDDEALDA